MTDLLERWALAEADWQREYGGDINVAVQTMTWRRFRVLLSGLSADGRLASSLRSASQGPQRLSAEATDAWALSFPKAGEL